MKQFFQSILQTLLFCMVTSLVSAQAGTDMRTHNWRLGVLTGASVNKFTQEQPHTGFGLGANAYLFADRALGKGWFIRASAGYAGFGGELTTFKDDTRYGLPDMFTFRNVKQSTYLLHAIDAGLAFFYQIPSQQTWKLNLGLGGGWANNVGEWENYYKTGQFIEGVYGTVSGSQFTDRFEPQWFHGDAHLELVVPTKKFNWMLQTSYMMGLSSVRKNYSYIEFPGVTGAINTNAFQLKLGISKNFKKKTK